MGDDEKRKAFLKGFEEGLKSAWREIGALTTRGYSSTELMVMAKSKVAVLYRDVEAMESRLLEEEGIPVVGEGEMPATRDLGRRGAYLVREPKADRIFELFAELLQAKARGLCITRVHPDDLRTRYRIREAGFIWLSKSPGQKARDMAVGAECARRHRVGDLGLRRGWRERRGPPRGPRVHDLPERVRVDDALPTEGEREDRVERLIPVDLRESGRDERAGVQGPREGSRGRGVTAQRPAAAAE